MVETMLAILAIWFVLASLITSGLYVWDKHTAKRESRRVSERTLLLWSLVGGWPGALITGRAIRHKTVKLSYRVKFVACAIANTVVVAAALYWRYVHGVH